MGVLGERRIGEKWKEMEGREVCIWDIYSWGFEAWRPSRPPFKIYPLGVCFTICFTICFTHVSVSCYTVYSLQNYFKITQKIPKNPQKITQKPTKSLIKSTKIPNSTPHNQKKGGNQNGKTTNILDETNENKKR